VQIFSAEGAWQVGRPPKYATYKENVTVNH